MLRQKLPSTSQESQLDLQVYTNLDQIEEALANDERYPMEGVEDFEERYTVS